MDRKAALNLREIDAIMAKLFGPHAYRVGGSVRDQLLGRPSNDGDYVVREHAVTQVRNALRSHGFSVTNLKTRDAVVIGTRAHIKGGGHIDVALPRRERATGVGRGFEIVPDPTIGLGEDALRRDFTFNAIYARCEDGKIIDPTNGQYDLLSKTILTTHRRSFDDDPLRILRALRFRSTLGFAIPTETFQQIIEFAPRVDGLTDKGVSGTAVSELEKILMAPGVRTTMHMAAVTGVLGTLFPELAPMIGFEQNSRYHDETTDEHTFSALDYAHRYNAPYRVRLALLFHDCGKPEASWLGDDGRNHYYAGPNGGRDHAEIGAEKANQALKRMNVPAKLRQDVVRLIERHMLPLHQKIRPIKVRRMRVELGDELLHDLFLMRMCDGMAGSKDGTAKAIGSYNEIHQHAIHTGIPRSVNELAIKGGEIKAHGPKIGEIQRALLDEVLAQPDLNNYDWLAKRAEELA
jgi:tRNA nucleotidyltransferase (CCA-adding enzyme)